MCGSLYGWLECSGLSTSALTDREEYKQQMWRPRRSSAVDSRASAKLLVFNSCAGVLNTDNMSILGLTIDYGPYGFLDKFDPMWTPNLTDLQGRRCALDCKAFALSVAEHLSAHACSLGINMPPGCVLVTLSIRGSMILPARCRYCYKNQIEAVHWNLGQFATALLACNLCSQEAAQEAINSYGTDIVQQHDSGMAAKMGMQEYDQEMVTSFLRLMYTAEADFTNTFRALSHVSTAIEFERIPDGLAAALGKPPDEAQTKVRTVVSAAAICMRHTVQLLHTRVDTCALQFIVSDASYCAGVA